MATFVKICLLRARCSSCYVLLDRMVRYSALAFRLVQLHALKIVIFMSHSGGSGSSLLYCRKIIIIHGKDIY